MNKAIKSMGHLFGLLLALLGLCSGLALPGYAQGTLGLAPSWTLTGHLNTARNYHTATLLPNGKLLVVGGYNGRAILNSAELYDPASGTWRATGSLNVPRAFTTATLLPNGKVLVAGGYNSDALVPTNTAEFYDPATGTWSLTGNLNTTRSWHSATLLQNGKVLIAGGWDGSALLNSAELYDPETGTWSVTGRLLNTGGSGRFAHTATLLPNGKVLVAGGGGEDDYSYVFSSAELYDPATGTWSVTGSLNANRNNQTATLLPNGQVLMAAGGGFPCSGGFCYSTVNNTAELYNPATGTWSYTGSLSRRSLHTATLLPNGQVLVAGGADYGYDIGRFTHLDSAELYDPPTGAWSNTARLNTSRFSHTATLLQNGRVLVAGGFNNTSGTLNSAELYDPAITSTINPIDDAQFFIRQHYLDFLAREPEPSGLDAWLNFLNDCPAGDLACPHEHRLTTSAAFFGSPEFQLKGYFVFRFYRAAFDRLPEYGEVAADMQSVTGQTPTEVYQRKATFTDAFARRPEYVNSFGALTNANYVETLLGRYGLSGVTAPDPAQPDGAAKVTLMTNELVARLDTGALTRAQVLRAVADSDEVFAAEYNQAFVAMQYYGYLRRTPEVTGYNAWLNYLNAHPQDFRTMVHGFVDSVEYRRRFGQP